MNVISWLLGFDRVRSLDSVECTLSAPWASDRGLLVFTCCVLGLLVAFVFYVRLEEKRSTFVTRLLISLRSCLLVLLVLTLAAPLVRSSATTERRPKVLVVVDNTQSMSLTEGGVEGTAGTSRAERIVELAEDADSVLARLESQADYRLAFATFSGNRKQPLATAALAELPDKLTSSGSRTDLNGVLHELSTRADSMSVDAVILISDFAHNATVPPLSSRENWLKDFPVPIWTVGVGQTNPADVAVVIHGERQAKLEETTTLRIELSQKGLTNRQAELAVYARALTRSSGADRSPRLIHAEQVRLTATNQDLDVPFTPDVAGPVELIAVVQPLAGELLDQNNTAVHRVEVIADHLRLLFVEHEPTWEWRFAKEVFQRDKLIGPAGFRTFLGSAEATVRRTNALFLSEPAASRAEFLASDVVLLGDVPAEALPVDFCNLLEEFVGDFGGGLVVLAGPRFGPGQLLETPIEGMLPVRLAADGEPRDQREFSPRRTAVAERYPWMMLAGSPDENEHAWRRLGRLPWYFPAVAVHEQADVLAEHPDDLCADGETRQPLIAVRKYGHGQVAYAAFNELWRLRSGIGQKYHQRLWSQLAYHLGMSHPVGERKRFVVRLDSHVLQVGDTATLTVDAFDDDFQPLGGELSATLLFRQDAAAPSGEPGRQTQSSSHSDTREIPLPLRTASRREVSFELNLAGEYQLEVTDPLTNEIHQEVLRVSAAGRELQNAARDAELQREIASRTGGQTYDIEDSHRLVEDLALPPTIQHEQRMFALWHTPLWFVLIAGVMLTEWTVRRWVHLR